MHLSLPVLASAAAFVGQVAAHGYVPLLRINGKDIPGWDISKGMYAWRMFAHYSYLIPFL